jgi:peptidoglycan/xylan/chitin deacetylase (PgdA/CDA1 family)
MLIRNKREFLARGLHQLGVVALLERFALRPCVLVLAYHRITDPGANGFYDPIDSATPDGFETHVRMLRDRFRLPSWNQWLDIAANGFRVSEPTALITFDDGYRDQYEHAFPILKKHEVIAAFFISTDFIDRPRLFWWDHVAYVMKQAAQTRVALEHPEPIELDLTRLSRSEAMMAVIGAYLRAQRPDEARLLAHLEERAHVRVPSEELGKTLLMSWDQILEMDAAGMGIGSHTNTHSKLARFAPDEQRAELEESKRVLELRLGKKVTTIAYPYGGADAFTEQTKRWTAEAGYEVGLSLKPGVNKPNTTDAYDVHRIAIGLADSPAMVRARAAMYAGLGRSFV